MFYNTSAKIRSPMSKSARRVQGTRRLRFTMTGVMIVLLPPFLMLAMAPMMSMMVPIALVLLSFMLATALSGLHAKQLEPRLIRVEHFQSGTIAVFLVQIVSHRPLCPMQNDLAAFGL